MTATVQHSLPMILTAVEVTAVELLSPSYVRVELGSPELAELPTDAPLYDQRIKLVFPDEGGRLASFEGADESWFTTWLGLPVEERGHMRTYTIREVRGSGRDTRIVVDFVLHPGDHGPGSSWAAAASAGDRVILLAPRRGMPFGGIEFAPGHARQLLLVGDETAVPAICSILADLPADAQGAAFLEVPVVDDVQDVVAPEGVEVHWLPRDGELLGTRVTPAVLAHLDVPVAEVEVPEEAPESLWETPTYSGSGEEIRDERLVGSAGSGHRLDGLYAWIAGESSIVTALRRHLVKDLGVDRRQVAFMGYWRRGVAMRS